MDLSVVIVNWNTRDLLDHCLQSVYRTAGSLELEVIVVDNASSDGSPALVRREFPQVLLIESPENVGFARANNQALVQSRGRCVLLLNSDTEVQPQALQHLMDMLHRYPFAGAVGPRMLNPDRTLQNSYGSLPSVATEIFGPYFLDGLTKPWGFIGWQFLSQYLDKREYIRVERVSFACTMLRQDALQEVGLLDEQYAFYSEDYDFFKRLKDFGWQVFFCPQAQVIHHWGASSSQRSQWATSQLYRSKRIYFRKHYGPIAERMLRFGLSVRFTLKLLINVVAWPFRRGAAIQQIRQQQQLLKEMCGSL